MFPIFELDAGLDLKTCIAPSPTASAITSAAPTPTMSDKKKTEKALPSLPRHGEQGLRASDVCAGNDIARREVQQAAAGVSN
jgi:hypothetical protein